MRKNPVSFAAIFTKNGGPDPLCSICFVIEPDRRDNPEHIIDYLVQTVVPQLAPIIPNSSAETVSGAIQNCMDEMEQKLGVCCRGFLTDYNLSISSKN